VGIAVGEGIGDTPGVGSGMISGGTLTAGFCVVPGIGRTAEGAVEVPGRDPEGLTVEGETEFAAGAVVRGCVAAGVLGLPALGPVPGS
jgi:hypothetical protein